MQYVAWIILLFIFPFSVRVSNELGAGRPQSARLAIYVVLFMVTIEGVLVATILISGHKFWGYSYSNEEKVVKYVGEIMVLVAVSHFWDGVQSVLSGLCQFVICTYNLSIWSFMW